MKSWKKPFKTNRSNYALYGALFGLLFPIMGVGVVSYEKDVDFITAFLEHHSLLIAIIDTAPLFLGLFASFTGKRQDDLELLNTSLRDEVNTKAMQLLRSQRLESLGELAGGIAHDFNNILAGISGIAHLAHQRSGENDKLKGYLDSILNSSNKAAYLVQQILGFARKGKYEKSRIHLNKIIVNIAEVLDRLVDKSISIESDLDPELLDITGDPNQVEQVFMNLAINARDAMPNGGKLTFKTENYTPTAEVLEKNPLLKHQQYSRVRVIDTGVGINKEVLDRVFDPFFTTKEQGKGTGLGLSMVYGIVQNHDGEIILETEKGKGCEFQLYFPTVAGTKVIPFKSYPNEEDVRASETRLLQGKTILVADDEEVIRGIAKEILEDQGAHVLLAKDGLEALEQFEEHKDKIGTIILDIAMPKMGGFEVWRRLREKNVEVKIIIASGYAENEQIREMRNYKNTEFFQKPFEWDLLTKKIVG